MPPSLIDLGGALPVFTPISVPAGAGPQLLASGRLLLGGWVIVNAGAGAERGDLFDGRDGAGRPVGPVPVPAGGVASPTLPAAGVLCETGLAWVAAGADLSGVVYVAHLD